MRVTLDEFNKIVSTETNIGINDKLLSSKLFKWFNRFPNQKERCTVQGMTGDKALRDSYAKFGIDVDADEYGIIPDREYVLILEDVDAINIQKSIENFINAYLPEGEVPTWYVVKNKKYTSLAELKNDGELIQSVVEGCRQLLDYPDLRNEHYVKQALEDLQKPYRRLGVKEFIDIADTLQQLDNVCMGINNETPKIFNEVIENLVEMHKQHPTSVFMYSGFNSDLFLCVACTLKYFYGIESIIPTELTQIYLNRYSSLVFDRDCMLVEDQLDYLKKFPTLSFVKNDYEFMIFIATNRQGTAKLKFCPVDNIGKSNVISLELDVDKIPYVRLNDIINFESNEEIVIREEHRKLLNLMVAFEDCILPETVKLNLTNTFYMELDGILGLAYIEKLDYEVSGLGIPSSGISAPQPYSVKLEKLGMLLPLTMLADWKRYASAYKTYMVKLGITELTNPPKHFYRNALLYKWFAFNGNNLMSGLTYNDFITIGLYWKEAIIHRTRLIKKLQANLGRNLLRSGHSFISAFGGVHPLIDEKTIVSSTNFRKGDLNV